ARTKIDSGGPQQGYNSASHVFAAVLAYAFHHRQGSAVAHGKALTGRACNVQFPGSGAIENGVAGENVTPQRSVGSGVDRDNAAAQAFADVVVGFAREMEVHSGGEERAEARSGRALKREIDRSDVERGMTKPAHDLAAQLRTDAAIGVDDRKTP